MDSEPAPNGAVKSAKQARPRGHVRDSAETRISKSLSWILRHGAAKEGLTLRADGYIALAEVLARPIMAGVDETMVRAIVDNDAKTRFGLLEEHERRARGLAGDGQGVWIKANQGHSITSVKELNLVPITDPDSVPEVIHGTYQKLLPQIVRSGGLKRLSRNHIHLATGLPFSGPEDGRKVVRSGIRFNCDCFIYIDLSLAIKEGLTFFMSDNGVVLTEGLGKQGLLPIKCFAKVVDRDHRPLSLLCESGTQSAKTAGAD